MESWPDAKAVTIDIAYTLINRIGVLPLVTFVLFYQVQVWLSGTLTDPRDRARPPWSGWSLACSATRY